MKIESEDTRRMTDVTVALMNALETALGHQGLTARQRDSIVGSLEDAARALSAKPMNTASDNELLDKLETFVLNLRVMGVSGTLDKKGLGKPSF